MFQPRQHGIDGWLRCVLLIPLVFRSTPKKHIACVKIKHPAMKPFTRFAVHRNGVMLNQLQKTRVITNERID